MKNICLAVDSFKGSASSNEIEDYIEQGIRKVDEDVCINKIPISDGGEGFVQIFTNFFNGKLHHSEIHDAYGRKTDALWGIVENKVILEVAEVAGLPSKLDDDDPLDATTAGLGELINLVLAKVHPKQVLIGLGGSSTNDMGAGMAYSLGYRFLDENDMEVQPVPRNFNKIKRINIEHLNPNVKGVEFIGFADVNSPLVGRNGATFKYGFQKGISEDKMEFVDNLLASFANVVDKSVNSDYRLYKGSGAAGGLGFGIRTFLNGKIKNSMTEMIKLLNIENVIKNSDLVITGEGNLDVQSLDGKVSGQIAKLSKKYHVPVIGVVGNLNITSMQLADSGFDAVFTTGIGPKTLLESVKDIKKDTELVAEQIFRLIRILKMN